MLDRCEIQALPWDELEGALARKEGEAIIAGLSVTPERRERLAFSRAYLQFPARFIVGKGTAAEEPLHETLAGKRIGVVAGSAHERMLRDMFPSVQVVTYLKPEWVYQDLKAGKLAGAFGDGMRMAFWLSGSDSAGCCRFAGGPYLAPEYLGSGLAIAAVKDNPELVQALDYALQQITVKGTFAELYLRYFPVSFF
jgi:polar amino acid transport system substrate-binding protein